MTGPAGTTVVAERTEWVAQFNRDSVWGELRVFESEDEAWQRLDQLFEDERHLGRVVRRVTTEYLITVTEQTPTSRPEES